MESLLQKAKKNFKKLKTKNGRLRRRLANAVTKSERLIIENKIDVVLHQSTNALLIFLGRKMEQHGRDLANAAKEMHNTPGETDIIIDAYKITPLDAPLTKQYELQDLLKQINAHAIEDAVDRIKDTFKEILDIFPDDDDEEALVY